MSKIQVLDQITIDKIAAGEVIERPASIVKELAENAIDAKATAIVIEIKEGGIAFIRITDNGCGIAREEVPSAFLRHATSKIRAVEDLTHVASLGFRGEALSSISAVAQVELITKTKEDTFGSSYRIEGGKEISFDETGAPDGTTFLIRQLFYNTPARRKFLKTPMTEASHIGDLVTRLALSHPDISFQFINNGQSKIHTSGNGNLKDVIYHVYGRDIASHLLPVSYEKNDRKISGFIGEPTISRGNRNFENYFINGRYVKNNTVSKAIEDAYKDFTMQHKYPFTVLHIEVNGEQVDVNVHPAKLEIRFQNQQEIYNFVCKAIGRALHREELIPSVEVPEPPKITPSDRVLQEKASKSSVSDVFFQSTLGKSNSEKAEKESALWKKQSAVGEKPLDLDYFMEKMKKRVLSRHEQDINSASSKEMKPTEPSEPAVQKPQVPETQIRETVNYESKPEQLNLFEEKLLTEQAISHCKLIGQVFETYWLVEYHDSLYIIDQHAAHERVLYEKTLSGMKSREHTSQTISPPLILDLSMQESELLCKYMDQFTRIGFEIEEFGQDSYAVRAVPDNLFSIAKKDLLMEMIDSLSDEIYTGLAPDIIDEKIASMSCKAAVKGNMKLSSMEAQALIDELLKLENPYHCPHGRPTIIAMTKRELEKKFKRIV